MPLTAKGEEIMRAMKEQYGEKKGEEVFYASKNAGKITGVDSDDVDEIRSMDSYDDVITKQYTITGPKDFMIRLEQFLAFVQYLGRIGHSTWAGIGVDGDGADRIEVTPEIELKGEVLTRGTYPDNFEFVGAEGVGDIEEI